MVAPRALLRAPAPPRLRSGVCQVWWARPEDVRPGHDALLAEVDRARRSRLSRPADRRRLTAAWAVARVVLGAATGVHPDRLLVDRGCPRCGGQHGKPWLPARPDLHFSLAHSGSCVVVAAAFDTPVGVDVEEVAGLGPADVDDLAGATLAGEERAALAGLPAADRTHCLTTCWTRKEAVLKATGDGLAAPVQELVVSPATARPRVLRWTGQDTQAARLSLRPLRPPAGHVATLAVLDGASTRVVERDAGPMLRGS